MNTERLLMSRRLRFLGALALCLGFLSCGDNGDPGCDTCLVVQNVSDVTIDEVNFSSCSSEFWGADRLGGGVIDPGDSREWGVDPGCYDVRCIAREGAAQCTISWFGEQIADGERHTIQYDGCDVVPPGPTLEDLVGSWTLTFWTAQFDGTTVDLVAAGATGTLTLASNGRFQFTLTIPTVDTLTETGSVIVSGNTLIIDPDSDVPFSATFSLAGNMLTFAFTADWLDADDDGIGDPMLHTFHWVRA